MSTQRAFSLVELLTVLAIVMILFITALPSFIESRTASQLSLARVRLAAMKVAMEQHLIDWGSLPADFNDTTTFIRLYRTRKSMYGYEVCSATPTKPTSKGGLMFMGDSDDSIGNTQTIVYSPAIYCPLTSPVRYIADNQTFDPFSDGTVPFGYDSKLVASSSDPYSMEITYGVFSSAGPDRVAGHWYQGWFSMSGCPLGDSEANRALPYSPTNGSNSCGELWGLVSLCGVDESGCLADSNYQPRQNFGPEFPESDEDGDGLNTVIESRGPNNGDGNHDGVLDSQQSHVASLPDGGVGDYVTLISPPGSICRGVTTASAESVAGATAGLEFPLGLIGFQVEGVPYNGECDVVIRPTKSFDWESYYKYGATPESATAEWYSFVYDGTSGAEFDGSTVILHFMDGARGDDDLKKNLTILDQGGPTGVGETSATHWNLYK